MKTFRYYLIILAFALLGTGCAKNDDNLPEGNADPATDPAGLVQDGYFVARFDMGGGTRAKDPTTGPDTRVQHIRYLIFKETGEFVKERELLKPTDGTPEWPFNTTLTDTLPEGNYQAVFLGNVDASLFTGVTDSLAHGYGTGYANTRIELPNTGLTPATEYYMGKAQFSDGEPAPEIWLQRIIGGAQLHRNSIDAQDALNTLVDNIFAEIDYRDIIQQQLNAIITTELTEALGGLGDMIGVLNQAAFSLLGGVDAVVGALVQPIADAVLEPLVSLLVDQLGAILAGNTDEGSLLEALGIIFNPWAWGEAGTVIATINNFPRQIDLDLNVTSIYNGLQKFAFAFEPYELLDERDVFIRGFSQGSETPWDIRELDVVKYGLVSGLVVDVIADDLLLPGSLVDINDPVSVPVLPNIRFRNNYSLLDIGLKDYTVQEDGEHGLSLSIRLGDIANLSNIVSESLGILGAVVGWLLDPVLSLIEDVTIAVPVNVPLLGIENLSVSGGWGENEQF